MDIASRDLVDQLQRLLRWRSRAAAVLGAFLTSALVCGTLWAALAFVPVRIGRVADGLLLVPLLVLVVAWWRSGRADVVPLADRRLKLRDGFRTWLGRTLSPPWEACLRAQLDQQLRGQDLRRALPPQRIGRARHLLFPLLLLLFLRFGLPDFLGSRGGDGIAGQSSGGNAAGDGSGGTQAGASDGTPGNPSNTAPPQKGGGGGGARPPAQPPPEEQPRTPPGALPEAEKHVDAFVPPAFDKDGPRTEREVAAAERPVGGQSPPPGAASAGGGAPEAPELPDLRPAVEEAIQRRRIEPAEAAFMRRYFAELRRERR